MTAGRPAEAVARFEGELRRFVARRVSGPDADDVLQDTLVRIHLGIGALRSSDRLAPWVYRVARSAIIDHHRRARPCAPLDEAEAEELPEEPASEVRPMLTACVEPFLDGLPPEQAEALRLTDLGSHTQAEAATRLGVPLPTLKARVQRGRKRMREAFEVCCELERDARGAVIAATPRCGCG
ncbi:MAG: sigma-70 family RNA polymerase sigma factor [Pseudomonadota bacterium]|nr:sigma-70 family RNA polymerase sigma factor [Pseudomonadota bacterium]